MANKLTDLQNALDKTRAPEKTRVPAANDERQAVSANVATALPRQANRVGRVNIAAWLHPDFKSSLRLIQARAGGSIQDLMEEALNDLFSKHDVPQVIDR